MSGVEAEGLQGLWRVCSVILERTTGEFETRSDWWIEKYDRERAVERDGYGQVDKVRGLKKLEYIREMTFY
jgi:hypothetical protein